MGNTCMNAELKTSSKRRIVNQSVSCCDQKVFWIFFFFKNNFPKVLEKTMDSFNQRHQVRIGWSTFTSKSNLGTDFEGVGYDNYGIKYYGGIQKPFGEMFSVGDTIRCCIDMKETYTISYFKNGNFLGTAYKIPDRYQFKTFYPHICLRNFEIEVNFGYLSEL